MCRRCAAYAGRAVLFALLVCPLRLRAVNMDSVLLVLDTLVRDRVRYEQIFVARMDSLRREARTSGDRRRALQLWEIVGAQEYYHSSSCALDALGEGIRLARQLGDEEKLLTLSCKKALVYGNLGLPHEGESLLKSFGSVSRFSASAQRDYYEAYNDLYDFYRQGDLPGEVSRESLHRVEYMADSIRKYLQTPARQALNFLYSSPNVQEMLSALHAYFATLAPDDGQRALVAAVISNKYHLLRDIPRRDFYWALSSIYSLRHIRYEYEPLQRLANRLFETGDAERAARYAAAAYDMAEVWGSRIRKAESAPLLRRAVSRGEARDDAFRRTLRAWQASFLLLFAGGGALVFALVCRARGLRRRLCTADTALGQAEARVGELATAVDERNEYVKRFQELSLDAVFEMEQMRKTVLMRLKSDEVNRLYKYLADKKQAAAFQSECLKRFDISFLRMYPDFPKKVNRLFRSDEQIRLSDGEWLNNELRILAFMKIGIHDGLRIATILGVSVNTVYFYRNRLKLRAINRETLADDIARI